MMQIALFDAQTIAPGDRVRHVNAPAATIWDNRDILGTVQSILPAPGGDRCVVRWDTGHVLTTFVATLEQVR